MTSILLCQFIFFVLSSCSRIENAQEVLAPDSEYDVMPRNEVHIADITPAELQEQSKNFQLSSPRFAEKSSQGQNSQGVMDVLDSIINVGNPVYGQDIQGCVACQYIWLQVEQDLAEEQNPANIFEAFIKNCIDAQKTKIFYTACSMMYLVLDDFIRLYQENIPLKRLCGQLQFCWKDTSSPISLKLGH